MTDGLQYQGVAEVFGYQTCIKDIGAERLAQGVLVVSELVISTSVRDNELHPCLYLQDWYYFKYRRAGPGGPQRHFGSGPFPGSVPRALLGFPPCWCPGLNVH